MVVRFFTFEKFHNKRGIGSTRLRVHNLIKNWPDAGLYKYAEKPDVLIFQKVYATLDWKWPLTYPGIKILDICDADWAGTPDVFVNETMDAMDAVVVPTEAMRDHLQTMTATPVRVIKDRFDLTEFPKPKTHQGDVETAVWFGYSHNASSLKFAVPALNRLNIKLIVISDEDPIAYRWASGFETHYTYIKYTHPPYLDIQRADIAILPKGGKPFDRFKSENKDVIAELCGLPVVKTIEDLEKFKTADKRNEYIQANYDNLISNYDCTKSVEEYKELINEIRRHKA